MNKKRCRCRVPTWHAAVRAAQARYEAISGSFWPWPFTFSIENWLSSYSCPGNVYINFDFSIFELGAHTGTGGRTDGWALPSPRRSASGEGSVALGVRVCVCVSAEPRLRARRISLSGEGNALYPMLSSYLLHIIIWPIQIFIILIQFFFSRIAHFHYPWRRDTSHVVRRKTLRFSPSRFGRRAIRRHAATAVPDP